MKRNYRDQYRSRLKKRSLLSKLLLPITWPISKISEAWRATRFRAGGSLKKAGLSKPSQSIIWLLQLPFNVGRSIVTAAWTLLSSWTATRQRRALLWGMPALLCGLGAIALMFYSEYRVKPQLSGIYETATDEALKNKEFDSAKIYLDKLIDLDPTEDSYRFQLATVHFENDNPRDAQMMLRNLAPEDNPGYPPAHILLARQLLAQLEVEGVDPVQHKALALKHIQHALLRDPTNVDALVIASKLEIDRKDFEQATVYMGRAAREKQQHLLDLAVLQRQINLQAESRASAEQYIDFCLKNESIAEVERWLAIGKAHIFRARYRNALEALQKSFNNAENQQQRLFVQARVVEAQTLWAASIDEFRTSTAKFGERLSHLDTALQINPKYRPALKLLSEMAFVDAEMAERVTEMLEDMSVKGHATATVHTLLGTSAAQAGKTEQALLHLNLAKNLSPSSPQILNNLAWMQAHSEEPDLIVAKKLIESALEMQPDNYQMRHTRGAILIKSGDYRDALVDLQYALPKMRNDPNIHEQLSEVYAKLEQLELSIKHEAEAKRLREKTGT